MNPPDLYTRKQLWKFLLLIAAVAIGLLSLWYTNMLVKRLSDEERKKVELWAEATRQLATARENTDLSFALKVIVDNKTIPVILTDEKGIVLSHVNIDSVQAQDSLYLKAQLIAMREQHKPIEINVYNNIKQYIWYKNSILLVQLKYYPFVQLFIIALFILVAYLAFSSSRREEQNRVWVGMSKETAHQLGTPISSLMAWIEIMKEKGVADAITLEIEKDIKRLENITDRFSKIGSAPKLEPASVFNSVSNAVQYIRVRASDKVQFAVNGKENIKQVLICPPLFEWVIENLCRNAVDAVNGIGNITIDISSDEKTVFVDVADNGKGIPASKHKTIFKPGYTTKERGWGLGLSLSKRIIEEYHNGKIFVKRSEPGKGTMIRIELNA